MTRATPDPIPNFRPIIWTLIGIALIAIGLMGCNNSYPLKKPFVVHYKSTMLGAVSGTTICDYEYTDARGNEYNFRDDCERYMIGDTIK